MPKLHVPESAVQHQITDALAVGQWVWAHHPDSRRLEGDPGLPDLIAVHRTTGRLVFVECKGTRGRLSKGQKEWLGLLKTAGVETLVVTPETVDVVARDLVQERRRKR
ncbi:MAG: VRR-NUC domain-containing protein [Chloroflexota bacterium]|nr:VRR-NUC domain-containing protein [Chloroflexota bacterium]